MKYFSWKSVWYVISDSFQLVARRRRATPRDKEREELRHQMVRMDFRKRTAFACACAERIAYLHQEFRKNTGADEANRIRSILDELWRMLEAGELCSKQEGDELMRFCYDQIPFEDDFPDRDAFLIQATPGIVHHALKALLNQSIKSAVDAGMVARDVIDQQLMYELFGEKEMLVNDEILNAYNAISQHPRMVAEIEKQVSDLNFLSLNELKEESIRYLRGVS